jgi:hypothetical protein
MSSSLLPAGDFCGLACIAHKSSDQPATLRVAMRAGIVSDADSGSPESLSGPFKSFVARNEFVAAAIG